MKRVLVTGAGGFIGKFAVGALRERGFEVHGVGTRGGPPGSCPAHAWHCANLLNEKESQALMASVRPSHLLHLAWYAVPGLFWRAEENYAWVGATCSLVSAFAAQGGSRVVGTGTCAEYEWSGATCSEASTPLIPTTPYGVCKRASFQLLDSYAGLKSLSWGWGRVFHLFGPGEPQGRLVPSVIGSLLAGNRASCTDGKQRRDFMHVADVASALAALLDSDVQGPVNIATGEEVAVADLVSTIGNEIGRSDLLALGELENRVGEPERLIADVGRLRGEVGFHPRFDLVSGLRDTIDWWREYSLTDLSPASQPLPPRVSPSKM